MAANANDNQIASQEERRAAVSFVSWLEGESYWRLKLPVWLRESRALADWVWAGVRREGFMWGLTIGRLGDRDGIKDRWLYPTLEAAVAAIEAWTDGPEPPGWHLHPATGARRPGGQPP